LFANPIAQMKKRRRSGLRQPNEGKIYRKVGHADCRNDFSDTL